MGLREKFGPRVTHAGVTALPAETRMKRRNFQAKNEGTFKPSGHVSVSNRRSNSAEVHSRCTRVDDYEIPSGCRENFCFRAKADVTPSEQPRSRPHLAARGPSRRRRSRHPAARKGAGDESRARRPPRASDACDRARDRRAPIARARISDPDSNTMGDSSREARCEAWEDEQRRLDESWVSTPCPCVDDAKAPGQVRERPDSPSDTHPNVSRKLACPPNEQPRLNH